MSYPLTTDIISYAEYARHPGLRHSMAKVFRTDGPAVYKALLDGKREWKKTDSLTLGNVLHCAVLEPEKTWKYYAVKEKIPRRKNVDKERYDRQEATIAVLDFLSPHKREWIDDAQKAQLDGMVAAIRENPKVMRILEKCQARERSWAWKDKGSGLWLKKRSDASNADDTNGPPIIVEIKTTADPRPPEFEKSAIKYGYDTQAVWNIEGEANKRGCEFSDVLHVMIIVRNEWPYQCRWVQTSGDEKVMEVARQWCTATRGMIAEAHETGIWSESWERERSDLSMPKWYQATRGVG